MTDAPKRIWAFEDYPGSGAVPRGGVWCDEQSECPEGTPAYIRADLVEALEAENHRLREATEYDADAAKGMTKIVDLGDGAAATIIDPRSFAEGGPEWVMRYGNPCSIRFVVASLLESYDWLLSGHITTQEAVRRLRLMRSARAALRSTEASHD